ncbi:hypothetical protein K466DRAFT_396066 [Polyporus arcularius HHB13444]|uniref:Uncharacterized protein n=1 Tax=Polyporus arcularius HHB13444 TaxID=1314778 RepID=A0A5C3NU01_9APHY|nr:hypothetical protein K466DRAFT_396066 [Polyporus arcularius HHB13444]
MTRAGARMVETGPPRERTNRVLLRGKAGTVREFWHAAMARRGRGRWMEHTIATATPTRALQRRFPTPRCRKLARFGRLRPASLARRVTLAVRRLCVSALCELHRGVSLRSAVRRLQNEPAFHAARSLWPSRRLPVIDWPLDLAAYIRGPSPALPRVCRVAMPRLFSLPCTVSGGSSDLNIPDPPPF